MMKTLVEQTFSSLEFSVPLRFKWLSAFNSSLLSISRIRHVLAAHANYFFRFLLNKLALMSLVTRFWNAIRSPVSLLFQKIKLTVCLT